MIDRYLADVRANLQALRHVIAHDTLTVERPEGISLAYLKGRVTFLDGSQLAIAEIIGPSRRAYRFHYMDRGNRLIARWDSAPHHRHLTTFPFHLHTPNRVSESPDVNLPHAPRFLQARLIQQLGSP